MTPASPCANKKSAFFLPFVAVSAEAQAEKKEEGQSIIELGGAMRQFSVGDVVTCIPDMFLRYATPGDYKIIAAMPDRDGDHMYRVKSPLEEYERVVREGLLVKSEGDLPEEIPKKGSRRRTSTLPTLREV